jgi:hypothetical protein
LQIFVDTRNDLAFTVSDVPFGNSLLKKRTLVHHELFYRSAYHVILSTSKLPAMKMWPFELKSSKWRHRILKSNKNKKKQKQKQNKKSSQALATANASFTQVVITARRPALESI